VNLPCEPKASPLWSGWKVGFFTSWPVSTPISTRLKCAASLPPRPAEQRPQRYPQLELEARGPQHATWCDIDTIEDLHNAESLLDTPIGSYGVIATGELR
jgi:hypothetical protein